MLLKLQTETVIKQIVKNQCIIFDIDSKLLYQHLENVTEDVGIFLDNFLVYGEHLNIFPGLSFQLVYNQGAAFGILSDQSGWQRWFLVLVSTCISLVLIFWISKTVNTSKLELINKDLDKFKSENLKINPELDFGKIQFVINPIVISFHIK